MYEWVIHVQDVQGVYAEQDKDMGRELDDSGG